LIFNRSPCVCFLLRLFTISGPWMGDLPDLGHKFLLLFWPLPFFVYYLPFSSLFSFFFFFFPFFSFPFSRLPGVTRPRRFFSTPPKSSSRRAKPPFCLRVLFLLIFYLFFFCNLSGFLSPGFLASGFSWEIMAAHTNFSFSHHHPP